MYESLRERVSFLEIEVRNKRIAWSGGIRVLAEIIEKEVKMIGAPLKEIIQRIRDQPREFTKQVHLGLYLLHLLDYHLVTLSEELMIVEPPV